MFLKSHTSTLRPAVPTISLSPDTERVYTFQKKIFTVFNIDISLKNPCQQWALSTNTTGDISHGMHRNTIPFSFHLEPKFGISSRNVVSENTLM